MPPFSRGFWHQNPRSALSQRLWPLRNLGRRARKGASRGIAQGGDGGYRRQARNRDLGRRRTDAQLHVYRRLSLIGTQKLLHSDVEEPLNIGSDEMVTINQLVDIVEEIAGVKLKRNYKLDAPKGVRGRNSDNTLIKAKLGWAPNIPLRTGMEQTYRWIYDQAKAREEGRPYIAAAA